MFLKVKYLNDVREKDRASMLMNKSLLNKINVCIFVNFVEFGKTSEINIRF